MVFEVYGAAQAVLGTIDLAQVRGIIIVGTIHRTPRAISLQLVFSRELSILGACVCQRDDFETAVELFNHGVIPTDLLITSIFCLSQTQYAFAELEAGRAMKVLAGEAGKKLAGAPSSA